MSKRLLEKRVNPPQWIALFSCLPALLMACGLFTDSADRHRNNAEAYLLEGRNQEALIEFYQALCFERALSTLQTAEREEQSTELQPLLTERHMIVPLVEMRRALGKE